MSIYVPTGYSQTVSYGGARRVSTLDGKISLEQNVGKLSVKDNANVERTRVDLLGLTTIDPDGTERLRAGVARTDGRSGVWVSKPGVDIRDEGV